MDPVDPIDPLDQMLRGRASSAFADRLQSLAAEQRRPLLVAAVLLAGVVAAMVILRAPASEPTVALPRTGSVPAGGAAETAGTAGPVASSGSGTAVGGTAATSTVPAEVVVHIAGAVDRPGLVRLAPGARVSDAIAAAGGLRADADGDRLNLAAPLADGTRVLVPVVGQGDLPPPVAIDGGSAGAVTGGGGPPVDGRPDAVPVAVDINAASLAELDTLPGVGPTTAAAIVAHRDDHGPFGSVDELQDVRGIGPAKFEALRELVTVHP